MKMSLGRKQLTISLQNKPGRPKKTFARKVSSFIQFLRRVWLDNRFSGNRISRVLRRVLEVDRIKQLIGVNLAVVGLATSTQLPSFGLTRIESPQLEAEVLAITTTKTVQSPVNPLIISQRFSQFHPGLDIKAALGTPIRSVMPGEVKSVTYAHYGYGHYLIIDHQNGYESLYAHLSRIYVTQNSQVNHQTVIGEVGSTGWSTGPHLHLEIWHFKQPINPLEIIQ